MSYRQRVAFTSVLLAVVVLLAFVNMCFGWTDVLVRRLVAVPLGVALGLCVLKLWRLRAPQPTRI